MARHYYLLMAFSDHETAMAAERSFAQLQLTLVDLGQLAYVTTISPTNEGNWTVYVHPTGVSLGVAGDPPRLTSTDQLDEIAQQLYQQLRQVEGYICAVAGWEVAEMFIMEVQEFVIFFEVGRNLDGDYCEYHSTAHKWQCSDLI